MTPAKRRFSLATKTPCGKIRIDFNSGSPVRAGTLSKNRCLRFQVSFLNAILSSAGGRTVSKAFADKLRRKGCPVVFNGRNGDSCFKAAGALLHKAAR